MLHGRPVAEPYNLGRGWIGFDFAEAFGLPVKIVNDAAMQALGSYKGGKMLFLGLGTGLGSAMIVEGIVAPMELAHLPYKKGTYEDYVGLAGLERHGEKKWRRHVVDVVKHLIAALLPDDTVIGGGNVRRLDALPPNAGRERMPTLSAVGSSCGRKAVWSWRNCRPPALVRCVELRGREDDRDGAPTRCQRPSLGRLSTPVAFSRGRSARAAGNVFQQMPLPDDEV